MTAPRRALIVVDAQQEYFIGLLPIQYPPREESIQRISDAIRAAEQHGIPVAVVQHFAGAGAPVFNLEAPEGQLHDAVEQLRSEAWKTVVKQFGSVFPGTDLLDWLRERQVDTITLVGYMTNNCIIASASDAEVHGLAVEVLSDATGAIDLANAAGAVKAETVHTTLMALLHSNFAAVASTSDWVTALEVGAPLATSNLVESAAQGRA